MEIVNPLIRSMQFSPNQCSLLWMLFHNPHITVIIRKPDSLWGIIYPPVIAVILEAFCKDYNKVNEPILSLTCGKSSYEASNFPLILLNWVNEWNLSDFNCSKHFSIVFCAEWGTFDFESSKINSHLEFVPALKKNLSNRTLMFLFQLWGKSSQVARQTSHWGLSLLL